MTSDSRRENDAEIAAHVGLRPLVHGIPVVIGVGVLIVAAAALVIALTRDAGVPSDVAADYTGMMAGSLTPAYESADAEFLVQRFVEAGTPFKLRIASLDPEFRLVGGRSHTVRARPAAAWFYRDARSEMVFAEAFPGTVAELGRPAHVRNDRPPALHVFYKTTQTLVFWQDGPLVYAVAATLPSERTIALARRAASGSR